MILLVLSFLAGILTVLAPCILPLLPVVVGGGLKDGTRKGVFVITGALSLSVILFTLLLRVSTVFISVPQSFWSFFSGVLLIGFGIVTLYPSLWAQIGFVKSVKDKAQSTVGDGYQKKNLWGDILIGVALGPVFASCSPTYALVLALVLPVSFFFGFLNIVMYAAGLSFILILISLLGQGLMKKLNVLANQDGRFKYIIGVIFIVIGFAIITGVDKKVEAYVIDNGWIGVTSFEEDLLRDYKKDHGLPRR